MEEFLILLTAAIGKSIDSPEVQALFADQDITEKLSIDEDDYETYIERPMLGYSFNIISQPYVKNPKFQSGSKKVLILRGCHFYSEGKADYRQYQGDLPASLDFDDSRSDVLEKLGNSDWQYQTGGQIRRERWEFAETDRQLNIEYNKDKEKIRIIYFGIREFFTN